jgi:hypothetical protein
VIDVRYVRWVYVAQIDTRSHNYLKNFKHLYIYFLIKFSESSSLQFGEYECLLRYFTVFHTLERHLLGSVMVKVLLSHAMKALLGSRFIAIWHAGAQLAEAMRYKSEDRGFDSLWGHWEFLLA